MGLGTRMRRVTGRVGGSAASAVGGSGLARVRQVEAQLRRSTHGRPLADAIAGHRVRLVALGLDPEVRALLRDALGPFTGPAGFSADLLDHEVDSRDVERCRDALDTICRHHPEVGAVVGAAHHLLDHLAGHSLGDLLAA